jgi:UDP-N-acetylmuramate dehydrogenase
MQILNNEPLKEHVNYKIGGPTPRFYIIESVNDFKDIPNRDFYNAFILGSGTNVLVSDSGVLKAVMKIDIKDFSLDESNSILTIGSGYILNEAAKELADKGYKGLSHVSGIPGTIGGAVYMNASASHGAISDYLLDVEAYNRRTKEKVIFTKDECKFGFRSSTFQNGEWLIASVRFQLEKTDREEIIKLYNEITEYREKNYPLTFPSAGCWFKRDWGGKDIIKKIGMSGAVKGKAVASPMFPAFILNTGNATAQDVYSLVSEIQDKAKAIGEDMPCEIDIWGEI